MKKVFLLGLFALGTVALGNSNVITENSEFSSEEYTSCRLSTIIDFYDTDDNYIGSFEYCLD